MTGTPLDSIHSNPNVHATPIISKAINVRKQLNMIGSEMKSVISILTTRGWIKSRGMLWTALPASVNRVTTSWILLRSTNRTSKRRTVSTVATTAAAKKLLTSVWVRPWVSSVRPRPSFEIARLYL